MTTVKTRLDQSIPSAPETGRGLSRTNTPLYYKLKRTPTPISPPPPYASKQNSLANSRIAVVPSSSNAFERSNAGDRDDSPRPAHHASSTPLSGSSSTNKSSVVSGGVDLRDIFF